MPINHHCCKLPVRDGELLLLLLPHPLGHVSHLSQDHLDLSHQVHVGSEGSSGSGAAGVGQVGVAIVTVGVARVSCEAAIGQFIIQEH